MGVGAMVLVTLGYALIAALSKMLMQQYPVAMIAWVRYAIPFALVAALLTRTADPRVARRPTHAGLQLLRSTLMVAGTLLIMLAYRTLPLAQAISISSIHPVLLTLIAALVLRESVSPRAWFTVVLGFAGVLIIVRPGAAAFSLASFLPLLMALSYAGYMALTRRLAGTETPLRSLSYAMAVGATALTLVLPFVWVTPTARAAAWMALIGILSGATHLLMIKALELAPASTLAPVSYLQLLWSVILGAAMFGDLPDAVSVLGMAIIAGAGLLLNRRPRSLPRGTKFPPCCDPAP